jgi:hypothetical protein
MIGRAAISKVAEGYFSRPLSSSVRLSKSKAESSDILGQNWIYVKLGKKFVIPVSG